MPPSQPTPRINRLSATLAGQIAAGEVIERPASIIKELVENSLDAGADRIEIEVEQGGIHSIRVRDNGHGIHPDDLSLALESHATSKLHTAADLEAIRSLGFRGEALSSIAAVAGMELTSCMQGADQAWTVGVTAGSGPLQPRPAAHPGGTTVRVEALFQSLPARRKFLRAERTEYLHILETVRRLALCRFEVDIRLRHNRRQVLHCRASGGDGERRIRDIMGSAFARDAARLDSTSGTLRLWGWLGGPGQARSQSDRQYFYLNGRMIRDRVVTHAVRRALETAIPAGRFPSYVLHLQVDPARTDVNVHPTKQEVRFRQARDVHDFIHASIREAAGPAAQRAAESLPAAAGYRGQAGGGGRRAPVAEMAALYGAAPRPGSHPGETAAELVAVVDGYVLLRLGTRLLLLDAYRTMFRSARRQMQAALDAGSRVISRPLLVPLVLECRESEMEPVMRHLELLSRLGLELEQAGPVSLRLRSIPSLLAQAELPLLLQAIRTALARGGADSQSQCLDILAGHAADVVASGSGVDSADLLKRVAELDAGPDKEAAEGLWRYLEPEDLAQVLRRGRNHVLP